MKTILLPIAVLGALLVCSEASARVVVNAGGVHVAVGRPHAHPVARPVVGGWVAAPAAGWVNAPVAAVPGSSISASEASEIRYDARELRQAINNAGAVVTPAERQAIRREAYELRQDIRNARQN